MMLKSEIRIICLISNSFNHFNLRLEKLYVIASSWLHFISTCLRFLQILNLWVSVWINWIRNCKPKNSYQITEQHELGRILCKVLEWKFNAVFCLVKSISRALNLKQRKYPNTKSKKFNCLCLQTCCFIHYLWLFSIQIVTH